MSIKITLITLALVLPCASGPIREGFGGQVTFQKRHALADNEGWFDYDKAVRQVVRDHNKHRANLINLEQNVGRDAFNEGSDIKPFMEFPPLLRRESENLMDEANDEYWAGNVKIGTPSQTFLINFDTGSSDLWVPSDNYTGSPTSHVKKHKYKTSSTGVPRDGHFIIHYGDGSSVSGNVWTDAVSIAGINVTNQYFSAVTTLTDSLEAETADGILGLAHPSLSNMRQSPFINSAKSQGAIRYGVFGMKLAKGSLASELYIGGTNPAMYTGPIEWHPIVGSTGYWQIGDGKLIMGSTVVASGMQTIIDSGTTLMYGPPDMVATVYKNIPGSAYDAKNGFYSIPCGTAPPNIAFNWGGKNWTISAANINAGRITPSVCIGAIAGKDLGLGKNTWLIGDSFMKNVYSAFSFDSNSVGFATLK